jgi:hypothetical protein
MNSPVERSLQAAPDVDNIATVAEKASVGLPNENARLIDPDIKSDPEKLHPGANALFEQYKARARAELAER